MFNFVFFLNRFNIIQKFICAIVIKLNLTLLIIYNKKEIYKMATAGVKPTFIQRHPTLGKLQA